MTPSPEDVSQRAEATLERLVANTLELFWDFDRRFGTAAGRVSDPDHLPVLALLDDCFDGQWDHETISGAPTAVKELAGAWGGLRPGQLMYAFSDGEAPVLFAAWWPWGSGTTFSLRVGCRVTGGDDAQQQMDQHIRKIFRA